MAILSIRASFGVFGVIFNRLITFAQDMFAHLHHNNFPRFLLTGAMLGGSFGLLLLYLPELTGGGISIIPNATNGDYGIGMLLMLFLARMVTTLLCFGSGAPGGILPYAGLGNLIRYIFRHDCTKLLS